MDKQTTDYAKQFLGCVKATRSAMKLLGIDDNGTLSQLKREVMGALVNTEVNKYLKDLETELI